MSSFWLTVLAVVVGMFIFQVLSAICEMAMASWTKSREAKAAVNLRRAELERRREETHGCVFTAPTLDEIKKSLDFDAAVQVGSPSRSEEED